MNSNPNPQTASVSNCSGAVAAYGQVIASTHALELNWDQRLLVLVSLEHEARVRCGFRSWPANRPLLQ